MKITSVILWVVLAGLLMGNMYLFVTGMKLGSEISLFEKKIITLHLENSELEKKTYTIESLSYAASMAATMDFTKKTAPFYLDNVTYAMKN
ncbi:MAG: hypothetical protein Q7S61_03800 [bacterium]|nr:hypothetical protein [bacterium]